MLHAVSVQISVATEHMPSIGARKGDYVLDDGGPRLSIMHDAPKDQLNPTEAGHLRPVGSRTPSRDGS